MFERYGSLFRDFVEQCFKEIEMTHDFEIEELKIAEDHVHMFLGFPPKYSISNVVKEFEGSFCSSNIQDVS